MSADEWSGILLDGEEVLWQGKPDPAFRFDQLNKSKLFSMIFAIGFAIFWMAGASQAGGYFWMFGLFILVMVLRGFYKDLLGPTIARRSSFYTLTNKRAFIGLQLPGQSRSLESYPINEDTTVEYQPGPPGSIYFASKTVASGEDLAVASVGFEQIDDAQEVMRLIGQIQQGQIA